MATARDIVTRALRSLRVYSAGEDVSAEDLADGLDALNDMLAAWPNEEGIHLVHVTLAENDVLDVPDEFIQTIRLSLAEAVADDYGASLSPRQMQRAAEGRKSLQALYFRLGDLSFEAPQHRNNLARDW